ncbi:pyridoxamine 5'-phosphate oxidase family protein [Microtetraspora sp. AC03309]|uniref:pyridoxamine 5'-phosphate oxidase family protein n=1 Tax=Microtetraspora sp. AC03309 TaxID=2779376 RepID=UPI001E3DB460|nr:pyridoxamine 5'-phosphate oxidase family protein [Microtetraspora sp. AC03309]
MDGDDLLFNTDADSVKGRDLARDPRVSICVDDDHPPFAFVTVEGRATLIECGRGRTGRVAGSVTAHRRGGIRRGARRWPISTRHRSEPPSRMNP